MWTTAHMLNRLFLLKRSGRRATITGVFSHFLMTGGKPCLSR
jgi:hypothetical protein